MANTVTYSKLWQPVVLETTATTIYTASTITDSGVVKNISADICNTGATGAKLSLWVVPSGGTAGASNLLRNELIIPANDSLPITIPDMNKNDTLVGLSDTGTLTIHSESGVIIN